MSNYTGYLRVGNPYGVDVLNAGEKRKLLSTSTRRGGGAQGDYCACRRLPWGAAVLARAKVLHFCLKESHTLDAFWRLFEKTSSTKHTLSVN